MQSQEVVNSGKLRDLCDTFIRTADDTEIDFLTCALAHWATAYPEADHQQEPVIARSFDVASREFFSGKVVSIRRAGFRIGARSFFSARVPQEAA